LRVRHVLRRPDLEARRLTREHRFAPLVIPGRTK
jgi:hypothetical protein